MTPAAARSVSSHLASTVTRYVYDPLGRRTEERTDPQGLDIARFYGYDKKATSSGAKDPNGNLTRYAYDAKDRLVFTLDAAGGAVVNTYDAADRVLRRTGLATPLADVDSLALVPDWIAVRQQLALRRGHRPGPAQPLRP